MPGYVNIGAWVGPRTMVDTWATVGSCAQIGADVHLAGGVGIGGVLEPPNATPGDRRGRRVPRLPLHRHRGRAHRRRRRPRGERLLTASVPIIDVTGSEPVEHRGAVPPRAVVVPGTRPKEFPAGTYQLACALIIGWRQESHDEKLSLNDVCASSSSRSRRTTSPSQISSAGPTSVSRFSSSSSTAARRPASDGHRALAPAVRDRSRRHRDRARAGGGRLPRSALPDERGHLVRAVDADQLDVRALGEAVARLDPRPEPEQLLPHRRSRARPHAGCRPTPRSARPARPSISTVSISPTSTSPTAIAIIPSSRTLAGYARPPAAIVTACRGPLDEPCSCDPAAVARELRHRAVGVPDHDLGLGAVGRDDLEHAVRADAVPDVAEPAGELGVERPAELVPLDEQVAVTERVPLRESHPPPLPPVDPRRS